MAFDFREEALRGLVALREALDHLIGENFTRHTSGHTAAPGSFSVDVFEHDARYILQASLPGVKPDGLVIQAQGNLITIRGERRLRGDHSSQQWILREHQPVTFFRAIALPGAIDAAAASARLEYGLLTLEMPKAETVAIIPLDTRALPDEAVDAMESESAAMDVAPVADSSAETMDDGDTLPELAALDTARADVDDDPFIAEPYAPSAAENALSATADEVLAETSAEADLSAVIDADERAEEAAVETVTAILEAEAIVEAAQEAVVAAELAAEAGDVATAEELTVVAEELAATAEILAEALIEEEIAAAATTDGDDDVTTEVAVTDELAVPAAEEAATLELAEVIRDEQHEEVIDAAESQAASDAEVAVATAMTEASIIAQELVEEILHGVESEIVREIVAEMVDAQREAVADVIAEALLADVVSATQFTASPSDAISADIDVPAVPVESAAKREEIH